jgi:hypothetical protein
MADLNAFPNKELEDLNLKIKERVNNVLKNINTDSLNQKVKTKLDELKLTTSTVETGDDETWSGTTFIPNKRYLDTLPSDYKNKIYRYYDIFRDNPDLVTDYVSILQKHGSEKAAKEAGTDNVLFYPKKLKKYIKDNVETITEDTQKRWEFLDNFGDHDYDIQIREDDFGRNYQKEWLGKKTTKLKLGVVEATGDTVRSLSKVIAMVADAVGPENTKNAVDWIEANWPKADDITYPNKLRPFDQDSAIQNLTTDLAQFGLDIYTGGKLVKAFGWAGKKIAPGMFKKITNYVTKGKPAKTKAGKEIADSFGNIKYASSIAQKMGGWGLPVAVKYGLGRTLTSDEKDTTFTEGFGFMPPLDREKWNKMTSKERAVESLKRKLIHGAEGTVLLSGLTKAIGVGGKVIWGGVKWGGKTLAGPAETLVLNPISRLAAATTVRGVFNQPLLKHIPLGKFGEVPIGGLPLLVKGIRKGGGFIGSKVLRIPPYKNWAYLSTTQGPLIERIFAGIESKILPPLRVRGPWTKEAKEIFLAGQQKVARYKKSVGLMITQIDRSIYDMLGKGFGNRAFTSSSVGAGKQHWDDVIAYLRGEVKLDALPTVLRQPAKDIQQLIEKLSKEIKPYVKTDAIKKEIIDGMGKYLTTSYRIFQGSFKPDKEKIAAATKYFVDVIKKSTPKYKNVKPGHALWPELNRVASQKVDEILQFGKEGGSPIERLKAVTSLVTPDKILKKKQNLPKVIEDLMGKVNDPTAIIMDTVAGQAELLSSLFTHKSILREGLKSGWITTDPKKFAMEGVQKWVAKTLVPIKEVMKTSNIDVAKIYTPSAAKKAGNFWTTPEIANALKENALWTDRLLQWGWYKPILAAKTTAQLSKTVLSLMTQARNFETAMFFSIMQGHVGSHASVMEAMKFVFGDVIGKGRINPIAMNKKLSEWANVGILDTSIVGGEIKAVIGDLAKGKYTSTDDFFKALMNNPIFRKATEFYQGSDSIWKAYGYEFTKSQLLAAIPIRGLTLQQAKRLGYVIEPGRKTAYTWQDLVTNQFKEVFGMKWDPLNIDGVAKTYGDALKQIAGKYIRDVYPNYNIVPNLVAGWRRLPFGNFIAFRSENIRNVYNTMVYSMRELSSSNPFLRQMGAKRMVGLSATLYGVEEGMRAFTGALTNIDEDWMKKYQRWFSPWYDKTSTIFPVSKVDPITKKFWTLNWTREQPYEGVQDAFAQMFSALFDPVQDDEAMFKRFWKAFFYDFEEDKKGGLALLFEPFITPALLIEKILDISPMDLGGTKNPGVTRDGKIVFDPLNDSKGEILAKVFAHLFLDINPATIRNAKQVIEAFEGELSPSGKELHTANQITKMVFGLSLDEQNPIEGITFKVGEFTGRLKKTADDFRRDILDSQKLIEDPFLLPTEFDNLQANRYRELSRVYDMVMFLKNNLNMSNGEIMMHFKGRGGFGTRTVAMILNGKFNPANLPSIEITALLPKKLKTINRTDKWINNPLKLSDIYDRKELFNIRNKWMAVPLGLNDAQLEEYFITGEDPRLKDEKIEVDKTSMRLPKEEKTTQLTELITTPNNQPIETANVSQDVVKTAALPSNINPTTGLTYIDDALLSNEEKAMRLRQKGLTA